MNIKYRNANQSDYRQLKDIWSRSVDASHDFLEENDKEEIKANLESYFDAVNLKVWLNENDKIIGF